MRESMEVEKYRHYQAARALLAEYGLIAISEEDYNHLRARAEPEDTAALVEIMTQIETLAR